MTIRHQQMQSLADASVSKFEARMTEHLERCFPVQCKASDEMRIHSTIRYGIERAASYGINLERDVCKYIDLMFVFGRDYDRDPGLPWVSEILEDETLDDATVKTERLFAAAKQHVPAETRSPLL